MMMRTKNEEANQAQAGRRMTDDGQPYDFEFPAAKLTGENI